ncbi:MAG: hypothetical protein K0U74_08155 [Alphaproteobacteria bacterium]|nr:hypothetical protein [Alphaproteobacteria bacterium]
MCQSTGTALAQSCARSDFEAVVDEAASSLRKLNAENKPVFQEMLRKLKDKHAWSHDVFMKNAEPFVQDETIDAYDQKSQDLLIDIATLGEEGSAAATPDCTLLDELRARMTDLVKAQTAKWSYMFAKLEKEIAQ